MCVSALSRAWIFRYGRLRWLPTVGGRIETDALIISTGATAKYLGLASEQRYKGMGVSACATCDGFFYRKKDVIVVGGGDTACEEATYLATLCNKVYMVVRKDYLRASKAMQERVMKTPNIEVLFGYTTVEVLGDENGVTGALVRHTGGEEKVIDAFRFHFSVSGTIPIRSSSKASWNWTKRDISRRFRVSSQTSVKGVFAAGDVQDPRYRQAITAAGSGCMAALDCERYLLDIQCLQ